METYTHINTLNDLAKYINSCDDYPTNVEIIVKAKGWSMIDKHNDYDICTDGKYKLTMSENAEAVVVEL